MAFSSVVADLIYQCQAPGNRVRNEGKRMPVRGAISVRFDGILMSKATVSLSMKFADSSLIVLFMVKFLFFGSGCSLATGIVKRQHLSLGGTVLHTNGNSTQTISLLAPHSHFKSRLLIFRIKVPFANKYFIMHIHIHYTTECNRCKPYLI